MKCKGYKVNGSSGVSEVIGFIIILGLMVTGISLVTLYGYPILLKEQANANIRSMEKNLIVLQTDVNSLAFRNVPYKETSLQISGGTLSVNQDPGSAYFDINSDGPSPTHYSFYPGKLTFTSDDTQADVVLENGGVSIRYWSDLTGSAMLSEPRWYFDTDPITGNTTLLIPLVKINVSSSMSRTGMSTVKMRLSQNPTINEVSGPIAPGDLTVKYDWSLADPEANYQISWNNYFEKLGLTPNEVEPDIYQNSQKIDNLVIKQYTIEIVSL